MRKGIASHQATLLPDRTLDLPLLSYRSDEAEDVTLFDDGYGHYSGNIVWLGIHRAVQSRGSGRVTVHDTHGWEQKLEMGCAYRIEYDDGSVTIVAIDPSN